MARALTPALGAGLAALLGGCSLLLGEVDKRECNSDFDCPGAELCTAEGRCATLPPLDGSRPMFDAEVDAAVDAGPDATVDAEADALLDAEADGGDGGGLDPPFREGDCFGEATAGALAELTPAPGALHVPQVDCTPYARLWTADTRDGLVVAWDVDGDGVADGQSPMALGGRFTAEGPTLVVPRPNVAEEDSENVYALDLRGGDGLFLVPSGNGQRDPTRGPGRTVFVERGRGGRDAVVVHVDADDIYRDCGAADRRQWGAAAGPGWTAWFEQRTGSRRPRLVVTDALCSADGPRRERLLAREVGDEARLHAVDDGVLWLQLGEDGRNNQIMRWSFAEPGSEPAVVEGLALTGNPVELRARGHWLAVVGYRAAAAPHYTLDLVDLATGETRAVAHRGDARQPALSGRYVLWADKDTLDDRWSLRYERLDD